MNYADSGNLVSGLGSAMLPSFLNRNVDTGAPIATFTEMEVIHWLRSQLGVPVAPECKAADEVGGIPTPGGCLSSVIALMVAREHLFPASGTDGLPVSATVIRVLVPDVNR